MAKAKKTETPAEPTTRRRNVTYTHDGKTLTIPQWSRELNLSAPALYQRLGKLGWSVQKALTTPIQKHTRKPKAAVPAAEPDAIAA